MNQTAIYTGSLDMLVNDKMQYYSFYFFHIQLYRKLLEADKNDHRVDDTDCFFSISKITSSISSAVNAINISSINSAYDTELHQSDIVSRHSNFTKDFELFCACFVLVLFILFNLFELSLLYYKFIICYFVCMLLVCIIHTFIVL
jgi:hypothetical protein